MRPTLQRTLLFVSAVAAAVPAAAHVTVWPREAPAKGFAAFAVRVPTERESATIAVRVEFPAGLKGIRFQPKPGWKYEIERDAAGNIVGVTWSGGKVGRDELEGFYFTARMRDERRKLTVLAHQTYEDGEIVNWVDPEGSRPASKVEVVAARAGSSPAAADHGVPTVAAGAGGESRVATPMAWMNWVTLLIAVVALVAALRPSRRSA